MGGDERLVRLGFTAAAALRYTVGSVRLCCRGDDPALHPDMGRHVRAPTRRGGGGWAELWPFQLGLAEEARTLLPVVG